MLEKIYTENLGENLGEMDMMTFPDLVRFARELMGLKQYACADYLGMEDSRYKKLETGRFSEPIESWEMARLELFFKLPNGMLQKKQKQYLTRGSTDRMEKGKHVWNQEAATTGIRSKRSNGAYKRVRGTLE